MVSYQSNKLGFAVNMVWKLKKTCYYLFLNKKIVINLWCIINNKKNIFYDKK